MTIRFDTETSQAALTRLRASEQGLAACRQRSGEISAAFADADPHGTDRILQALNADFQAAMQQLQTAERELQDLISATEAMQSRFEEAEEQNARRFDRIAANAPAHTPPSGAGRWYTQGISGADWTPSRAVILPDMRGSADTLVPDWLQSQLDDPEQFLEWT